jgi:hypothetical protein
MNARRRRMFGVSMLTLLAGARATAQPTQSSATTQSTIATASTSTMRGIVTVDTSTTPIADAEVQLTNIPLRTMTDSAGRFTLTGVPVGTHRLQVRRIGYEPFGTTLTIKKAESFDVDIGLTSTATTLREIEVKENVVPLTLQEFYENKRFGFGVFITPEVFQKNAHKPPHEILLGYIPGVVFRQGRNGKVAFSLRGRGGTNNQPCPVRVSLNGLPPREGYDLGQVQTQDILGVDYYTTAQLPAIYRGTTESMCPVMVIRTK